MYQDVHKDQQHNVYLIKKNKHLKSFHLKFCLFSSQLLFFLRILRYKHNCYKVRIRNPEEKKSRLREL